ncbi:MAG: hypothetical protein JO337_03955 [Acidimicrobiales bacterium]|nr:hypothetical protein [Acidimicrobiales bacterium]
MWWRIDDTRPRQWDWTPFPSPRNRFDPASGRFRVRYAANRPIVAARERFPARAIADTDADLWLVQLRIETSVLALTQQSNLDALGVDDRISTGRIDVNSRADPDPILATCADLADAVHDWWEGTAPPLLYRSRTVPGVGRNLAFSATTAIFTVQARALREASAVHSYLVLRAGFTVPDRWLGG